ncbi:MAG: hypothetical protein DRN96_04585 [Thermoproteota archaeon]|nr:MAG: hypothetical protein DRN96_04585 [Candidatus Korarchaeota archaeon]RLG55816.1 MAG: hypothetical protein DRN99_01595 [Candidatus Korarchaeota archaeon]
MGEREVAERVKKALKSVIDPEVGMNIVDMGMIKEIKVEGRKATIFMELTVPAFFCPLAHYLVAQVQAKAKSLEEIDEAEVVLLR